MGNVRKKVEDRLAARQKDFDDYKGDKRSLTRPGSFNPRKNVGSLGRKKKIR